MHDKHLVGLPIRFSVYVVMLWMSAKARCCLGCAVVVISKVGALGAALGVLQVLRTMVARSAIRVEKLCAGVPSMRRWVVALVCAEADRLAGATGSRVVFACCWVSANINVRQASRMCHST